MVPIIQWGAERVGGESALGYAIGLEQESGRTCGWSSGGWRVAGPTDGP